MTATVLAARFERPTSGRRFQLWSYAHRPGVRQESPQHWPAGSRLRRSEGRPTLVFFAHSQCPCTRPSIRELERLAARVRGKVATHVVLIEPSNSGSAWPRTDLKGSVSAIHDVHVTIDHGGVECEQFRARTSGLVLLYADTGELLFEGGVTSARGHEGANDGIAALEMLIVGRRSGVPQTPVFGCPLQTSTIALRDPLR